MQCPAHNLLNPQAWWSWTGEHLAVGVDSGITQLFSGLPVLLGTEPICSRSRPGWMGLKRLLLTTSQNAAMHVHWRHSDPHAATVCCLTGTGLGKDEHGDGKRSQQKGLQGIVGCESHISKRRRSVSIKLARVRCCCSCRATAAISAPAGGASHQDQPRSSQGRSSRRAPQQQTSCSPY